MDFKPINYEDETEFEEMLNKMHNTQLNSTLLESPSATKCGLVSIADSPCSPNFIKGSLNKQSLHNSAMKTLNFSPHQQNIAEDEEEDYDSGLVELDLNKTYSSKTMDQKQLSLMLAALEEDDD